MKHYQSQDFTGQQLLNTAEHVLAGAPSAPTLGQYYYNSSSKVSFQWNGIAWRPRDAAALTDGSIPIAALATNPLARANHTGQQAASTILDLAAVVQAYRLDQFAAPAANVAFGGFRITGHGTAIAATDVPNLQQVQQLIAAGVAGQTAIKNPAHCLADGNVTQSGVQTIDGYTGTAGTTRVLCTGMTDATKAGLYIMQSGAWTRASDADESTEWVQGTEILIANGTTYGGTIWRLTTAGTTTPGTSSMTFAQVAKVNTYTADGVTLQTTGMQFSARLGWGLTTDANGIAVDRTKVGAIYKGSFTHDGTKTSFTITHNLVTQRLIVGFQDASGNGCNWDWVPADNNSIAVTGGVQPNGTVFLVNIVGLG